MANLADRRCRPCEGGVEPLTADEARQMTRDIDGGWSLAEDNRSIGREFRFAGFGRTMAFVNAVAWIATVEGHHPELCVTYGRCVVRYTTNAIDGLSENDFICAAKIDRLVEEE